MMSIHIKGINSILSIVAHKITIRQQAFVKYSSKTAVSLIQGIFPPLTTPFDKDENISFENMKANISRMEKVPFRGYVVLGSTGEVVSLSLQERVDVVKAVKEFSSCEKLIIAGSGMESTKATVELTGAMANAGADAALVVSPSFYKGRLSDDALFSHYTKVADSSEIPIILYSVPSNTSIDLSVSLIAKLADHPNIIGLKDSGGDITKIGYVLHQTKGKAFHVAAGSAGFLYPALTLGCVGGVLALANSLGSHVCKLYQFFCENKHEEARTLQQRLIGPNLCVTKIYGIAGVKKSMDLCGYYGGPTRSPLLPLTSSEADALQQEFKKNGFL